MRLVPLAVLAATAVLACSKVQPPTLAPEKVIVTSVDPKAMHVTVTLSATNPNAVDIPVQSVSAHVVVAQKVDLGPVTVSKSFTLAAGKATPIDAAMDVPWGNAMQLAQIGGGTTIPFTVDGNVELGGDLLHVTVPYHLTGSMTSQQVVGATLNSLVPGLNLPH
jgi:LEA14-like dessication related protein